MSPKEKELMGIKETLVRLCFGFEDIADLKSDLDQAFKKLGALAKTSKAGMALA